MAYNLVEQNVDIPRYTIAGIKQLSEIELLQLAQSLTMKTTNIHLLGLDRPMKISATMAPTNNNLNNRNQ